jgi:hypothetical protein
MTRDEHYEFMAKNRGATMKLSKEQATRLTITTVEAAARWIQDYLRDGPRPVPFRKEGHISQQPLDGQAVRNVKTKAFREALKQLGVTTLKSGPKGGACWHMPVVTISNEAVEKQTAGLVHYSAMCREIQHCARIDEVKNIRDKAMALAVYAKQALNHDAEKKAAEVRLRAEIRAGELLKVMEKAKGGAEPGVGRKGKNGIERPDSIPTLPQLGISPDQSSQWQKLAAIPEKVREAYIAEPHQIPSAGGLLAKHAAKTIEAQPQVVTITGTVEPDERVASARRTKVLLNLNNLRLADLCQKEARRYTLDAVLVTRDETVVTNGHYLVRVTLPKADDRLYPNVEGWPADSGDWTEALIPRATAIEALKNVPRKEGIPILNNAVLFKSDDGRVRIGTTAITNGGQNRMVDGLQEGGFPDWKAVMPKEPPRFTITLDADHVARLAKNAAEFMADQKQKPLRLQFTTTDSVVKVRMDCAPNHEGQQWTAILMPMRGGSAYRNGYEADPVPDPFKDVSGPELAGDAVGRKRDPEPTLDEAGRRSAGAGQPPTGQQATRLEQPRQDKGTQGAGSAHPKFQKKSA